MPYPIDDLSQIQPPLANTDELRMRVELMKGSVLYVVSDSASQLQTDKKFSDVGDSGLILCSSGSSFINQSRIL